jgi:hypothetical protein
MDTIDLRGLSDAEIDALIWRKRGAATHADNAPLFAEMWRVYYPFAPAPTPEWSFAQHIGRKWRFDWAWVPEMVAVEIDGGFWMAGGGRHSTDKDREKLNKAAALGWCVLHFSKRQLVDDPLGVVEIVKEALEYDR